MNHDDSMIHIIYPGQEHLRTLSCRTAEVLLIFAKAQFRGAPVVAGPGAPQAGDGRLPKWPKPGGWWWMWMVRKTPMEVAANWLNMFENCEHAIFSSMFFLGSPSFGNYMMRCDVLRNTMKWGCINCQMAVSHGNQGSRVGVEWHGREWVMWSEFGWCADNCAQMGTIWQAEYLDSAAN